ncbi:hypothetical protein DIPPA_14380 [Diplonema papillatum]|nr:hypothetical protein DIPPA_14380 [Diplonema papillatum]
MERTGTQWTGTPACQPEAEGPSCGSSSAAGSISTCSCAWSLLFLEVANVSLMGIVSRLLN